jgi:hypothetical protein
MNRMIPKAMKGIASNGAWHYHHTNPEGLVSAFVPRD